MPRTITLVTRRAIVDVFASQEVSWSGRLGDSAFLSRLYDLTDLPSTDGRFANAAGDIRQHRENWSDWPDDWVFTDDRFNLFQCSDDEFLRFLCETVHPVVRFDAGESRALVEIFNRLLAVDGWKLARIGEISGRPVYSAQPVSGAARIFEEPTGWQKVDRQLQEVKARLDAATTEEQYQAVGLLCREALISVGQAIYDRRLHKPVDGPEPSQTDARRQLEAVFDHELSGSANEEARGHAKAAVKLAVALQHKRTADFRTAALCAEATASVVNLAAIAMNKRR